MCVEEKGRLGWLIGRKGTFCWLAAIFWEGWQIFFRLLLRRVAEQKFVHLDFVCVNLLTWPGSGDLLARLGGRSLQVQ